MKLKRLVLPALFAAGLLGHGAQAQTHTTSSLTLQSDGAGGWGAVFGRVVPAVGPYPYSFADTYVFQVDSLFTYAGTLTSLYQWYADDAYHTVSKDLGISRFGLYTYDTTTGTLGTLVMAASDQTPGRWGYKEIDRWSFSGGWNQAPGTYALYIEGGVNGNAGGSYAGDLGIIAVPEPEHWGMLAAGLGMVGWMARRKQRGLAYRQEVAEP